MEKNPESRKTLMSGLKELIEAEPTLEHYEQYFAEAKSETNDRGAALLLAANLENVLDIAIIKRLRLGEKSNNLFGINSPLGTFGFKIRISSAIGIIGNETVENLSLIKAIRNTFAHAKIPVKFSYPSYI